MSSAEPATSPVILLFARGVLALLDLWPALTIAVNEQWGGPESADKKTWLASTIIDNFEIRAAFLPNTNPPHIDTSSASDPPLDFDELGDLLNQMMSDEFDANIEDGSIDMITQDILRLWKDVVSPPITRSAEETVSALEKKAGEIRKSGVKASRGNGPEEMDGSDSAEDSGEDDEGGMDVDVDEAPQLVDAKSTKERIEPVVDEDGFELVQKSRRR